MKIKRKIFVLTGIAGVASLPMCFTVSAKEYNQNLVNTQKIKKIIEDEESIKIDRLNIVNVKTLDENENSLFLIQKNNNDGIYIYDSISEVFIEKIPSANIKFESDEIYYFGNLSYYKLNIDNEYINLIDNKSKISQEEAELLSKELSNNLARIRLFYEHGKPKFSNKSTNKNKYFGLYKKEGTNEYYINDYEYAATTKFPINVDGTCGYTASTILLYWWHKKIGNVIPDKFLDQDGTLKVYGYTLQDELLSIGKSLGIGNGVWAKPMQQILLEYAKKYISKSTTVHWYFFKTYLWGEIDSGRPALGHGMFSDNPKHVDEYETSSYSSDSKNGHVVVIYGYTDDYYICNYGWRGFEKVFLMSPVFGSVNFLKIEN